MASKDAVSEDQNDGPAVNIRSIEDSVELKPQFKLGFYSNPKSWNFHLPTVTALGRWKIYGKKSLTEDDKERFLKDNPVKKQGIEKMDIQKGKGFRALWIGHASLLVNLDGVTIMTDPVFSDVIGSVGKSLIGYKRYRESAVTVDDLKENKVVPKIVLISHNHYDHLDADSVKDLQKTFPHLIWLVPKGVKSWFHATEPGCKVHELTWWDEASFTEGNLDGLKITFTPAKHWSWRMGIRSIMNTCLWGSWVVEGPNGTKFFFAGDTGYQESLFKSIGEKFGPFDFAAIPVGAYEPRDVMQCQHVDPKEAFEIHRDIRSRFSLGIHWGTLIYLSDEPVDEPKTEVMRLAKLLKKEEGLFLTKHPGEIVMPEEYSAK